MRPGFKTEVIYNKCGAVSSCTSTFFFLDPHNFVNSKVDLDFLFEIGI